MNESQPAARIPDLPGEPGLSLDMRDLDRLRRENERLEEQIRQLRRQQAELLEAFGRIQHQELRLREELLQKSLYLDAVLLSEIDFFFKDRNGRYLLVSRGTAAKLKGPKTSPVQIIGTHDEQYFCPRTVERHQAEELRILKEGRVSQYEEVDEFLDGRRQEVLVIRGPIWDPGGKIIGTYGVVRDITEVASLRRQIEGILHTSSDAILLVDRDGRIVLANPAVETLFRRPLDEVVGAPLSILIGPQEFAENLCQSPDDLLGRLNERALEVVGYRRDGSEFPGELALSSVELDGRLHLVGVLRDITERKLAEERLKDLAERDGLTGFYNQSTFPKKLARRLEWAREGRFVVVVADLDRFKPVNDHYGHEVGDQVLRIVADRLRRSVKKDDLLGRIGGDEFAVAMDFGNLEDPAAVVPIVERRLNEIRANISKPYHLTEPQTGESVEIDSLGISLGFAVYGKDAFSARDLLRLADHRMYRSKLAKR
ncbi:MAG: hypothetical protein Kow00109_05670 [Acidobacteriota bacterium]